MMWEKRAVAVSYNRVAGQSLEAQVALSGGIFAMAREAQGIKRCWTPYC